MMTSKYRHDGLRDIGLGDAVMVSKERWRKHVNELDFDGVGESDKENEWVVAPSSQ